MSTSAAVGTAAASTVAGPFVLGALLGGGIVYCVMYRKQVIRDLEEALYQELSSLETADYVEVEQV